MLAQMPALRPGARPIVLLVDDDADTLDMYAVGLAGEGFRPVTTRDVTSVALQVDALNPTVIVTDVHFRDGSGWAVVELLKRSQPPTPVVVLTSSSTPAIAARAQELGCAAVVAKPCLPDDLADILRTVLHL